MRRAFKELEADEIVSTQKCPPESDLDWLKIPAIKAERKYGYNYFISRCYKYSNAVFLSEFDAHVVVLIDVAFTWSDRRGQNNINGRSSVVVAGFWREYVCIFMARIIDFDSRQGIHTYLNFPPEKAKAFG